MRFHRILTCSLVVLLSLSGCDESKRCKVKAGETNFNFDPNSAAYSRLNTVGGYEYFVGGNRGVVVVRTSLYSFVAFDRTCPEDGTSQLSVSDDWGSALMECPTCGSRFNVYGDGAPIDGSATRCFLYQYRTRMDDGLLYIY